jgi:pimeloyl-ACP methyl ester carboxylesterase
MAAAYMLPERVRGVLLLSPAVPYGEPSTDSRRLPHDTCYSFLMMIWSPATHVGPETSMYAGGHISVLCNWEIIYVQCSQGHLQSYAVMPHCD